MDRNELKNTLHEQFAPMDEAVQKKLDYLQSDDVFTDNPYMPEDNENEAIAGGDSLMSAFGATGNSAAPRTMKQPPIAGYTPSPAAAPQQSSAGQTTTASSSQSMAARIAALRGISMPGDYIKRKN